MTSLTDYFSRRTTKAAAAAPAPVKYDADPDATISKAWNLSLEEWNALTDSERKDMRDRVVYAPNFHTEGN